MPDMPEIEKTPTADTSVNSPESGTYGEKADLNRLRQALPPMGPPGSEGTGAAAPAPTPGRRPGPSSPGIPDLRARAASLTLYWLRLTGRTFRWVNLWPQAAFRCPHGLKLPTSSG